MIELVGGYASRTYEMLEDLAERADWCARVDRDQAIADYLKALHAVAAARTANGPRRAYTAAPDTHKPAKRTAKAVRRAKSLKGRGKPAKRVKKAA